MKDETKGVDPQQPPRTAAERAAELRERYRASGELERQAQKQTTPPQNDRPDAPTEQPEQQDDDGVPF